MHQNFLSSPGDSEEYTGFKNHWLPCSLLVCFLGRLFENKALFLLYPQGLFSFLFFWYQTPITIIYIYIFYIYLYNHLSPTYILRTSTTCNWFIIYLVHVAVCSTYSFPKSFSFFSPSHADNFWIPSTLYGTFSYIIHGSLVFLFFH